MSYYEHGEWGRIVMICQVCKTKCHESGPKEVFVQDPTTGAYRKAKCPMCVCHDCVQLADDPLRAGLAPHMLGQTAAKPFNIEQALNDMKGALGLVFDPPKQHALPRSAACECGEPARSRCISCDEALCSRCVKGHKCQKKEGEGS
jgi:hypothetical protein